MKMGLLSAKTSPTTTVWSAKISKVDHAVKIRKEYCVFMTVSFDVTMEDLP